MSYRERLTAAWESKDEVAFIKLLEEFKSPYSKREVAAFIAFDKDGEMTYSPPNYCLVQSAVNLGNVELLKKIVPRFPSLFTYHTLHMVDLDPIFDQGNEEVLTFYLELGSCEDARREIQQRGLVRHAVRAGQVGLLKILFSKVGVDQVLVEDLLEEAKGPVRKYLVSLLPEPKTAKGYQRRLTSLSAPTDLPEFLRLTQELAEKINSLRGKQGEEASEYSKFLQ